MIYVQYNSLLSFADAPKNVTATAHPGTELKEGSNVELICNAESVPPVSEYTWMKYFGTHPVRVGQGQKITLRFLNSSDSDHYFCNSNNKMGSAESLPIYIRVKCTYSVTYCFSVHVGENCKMIKCIVLK